MYFYSCHRDTFCGKLMCSGGNDRPLVAPERTRYKNKIGGVVCKAIDSGDPGSEDSNKGLVRDGTSCGKNQVIGVIMLYVVV